MKSKYFLFIILICIFCLPISKVGAVSNTGFITGQIWYSENPIIEGDSIKVYTAVWNGNSKTLSAKIVFYDKNVILGEKNIEIPPFTANEVYITWKATAGSHTISAKILSPVLVSNGKKENVAIDQNLTKSDDQYVPLVVETIDGEPATSVTVIKSEFEKATSSLDNILPTPVAKSFDSLGDFRSETLSKIESSKKDVKSELDTLNNNQASPSDLKSTKVTADKLKEASTTDGKISKIKSTGTDKPIAYIKLFFLSVLAFIFSSKLAFYGVLAIITFLILRFIYRKIRYR